MPRIEAAKTKNCAITKSTFAAMSCSSLMRSEVKAKAAAVVKDATAKALSIRLLVFIESESRFVVYKLKRLCFALFGSVSYNVCVVIYAPVQH